MAVSPSGFYEWLGRVPSQRSQDDAGLTRRMRESFELSNRTYDSPRVRHDRRALGETCGMNRVIRLMHPAQLQARRKRRTLPGDTASRLEKHIAPNHLQRDFQAEVPNQKWGADFTDIWTAEGWLYAAAVMDLYSRRIVGWSMRMSRRGECWDIAAIESFFSSLKTERLSRKVCRTREDARADEFDCIERFYNPWRKHSKLNLLSPMQFEQGRMR